MQLIHVALVCGYEENADRFYRDVLGLEKQPPKLLAGALAKQIFELPRERELPIINYVSQHMHFEIFIDPTHKIDKGQIAHGCIDVGEMSPFLEECKQSEVAVRRIPKGDKVITFIRDFDGNLFEVTGIDPSTGNG